MRLGITGAQITEIREAQMRLGIIEHITKIRGAQIRLQIRALITKIREAQITDQDQRSTENRDTEEHR